MYMIRGDDVVEDVNFETFDHLPKFFHICVTGDGMFEKVVPVKAAVCQMITGAVKPVACPSWHVKPRLFNYIVKKLKENIAD